MPAPIPTSINQTTGLTAGGTNVRVTGSGFDPAAIVTFGGVQANVTSVTATTIDCTTPANAAGTCDLRVTNPNGQAGTLTAAFTYCNPLPVPLSMTPTSGPCSGGTQATISGTDFITGASVTIGGTTAAVLGITPISISCTTPPHASGAFDLRVTNPDGKSGALTAAFIYQSPPIPTNLSTFQGPTAGGTQVTITGSNFQSGASVTFGGTPANVTGVTPTSITCTTQPHGPGICDVRVTNPDGQAGTLVAGFTYQSPPIPTYVNPGVGPTFGGTYVTISGTGFLAGATVTFGGTAANVSTVASTSITCITQPRAAGPCDVRVTNVDGQMGVLAASFTYQNPPIPLSLNVFQGPTGGGTSLTITGTGFVAPATVTIGGIAANVTGTTSTAITCTAPPHAPGPCDLRVINPDGQAGTLTAAFTYQGPPNLSYLSLNQGPTSGNTQVTLGGMNFQAGATASFGGTLGTVTSVTPNSITCLTPAHAAGACSVRVTHTDGQWSELAAAFTFRAPPVPTSINPASGPTTGATPVSIGGTEFQPGATVTIGGTQAMVSGTTPTTINATTPPHSAGVCEVRVTNPDGQAGTLAGGFTYQIPTPQITGVNPPNGPRAGGTMLTISGTGFLPGLFVMIDTNLATVYSVSNSTIICMTPAHAAGPCNVTVTNPGGLSHTAPNAYTYT